MFNIFLPPGSGGTGSLVLARLLRGFWAALAAACVLALAGCGGGSGVVSTCWGPDGKVMKCPDPKPTISLAKYVGKWQYCNGKGMMETRVFKSADSDLSADMFATRKGEAVQGTTRYDVFANDDCTGEQVGSLVYPPDIYTGVSGDKDGIYLFVKTALGPLDTSGKEYDLFIDGVYGGTSGDQPKDLVASGSGLSIEKITDGVNVSSSSQFCFVRRPGVKVCDYDDRWMLGSDMRGAYTSSNYTPGKTAMWRFRLSDSGWRNSSALYKVE